MHPELSSRSGPLHEWRPEIHFLLEHLGAAGLRADPDPRTDTSPGSFSWEYLQSTASLHGVLPLLFNSLSKLDSGSIPAVAFERMRRECSVIAKRNFIFTQELLRLVACLHDHDIVVVPYKGASLAATAYGDLSLRQFSDLDILVSPADVVRTKRLLEEQGYQARFIYGRRPLNKLTAAETRTFIKYRLEYEMQRKDGLLIDLHWQLAPRQYPFRIDPAPLWSRLVTVEIEGKSIPGFADEDLILILCMHGAKDQWKKLIWIMDVARVVKNNPALDWDLIFIRARATRMELPLLLGIRLVEELFAPGLPRHDCGSGSREKIARLAQTIFAGLFSEHGRPARFPVKSLHLDLCRSFSDKIRYTCQALFVPSVADWALIRLPAWLYPLYYVVRPLYILAVWAWSSVSKSATRRERL